MSNRTIIRYFSAIQDFDPSTIEGNAMHINLDLSSDTQVIVDWGSGDTYTMLGSNIIVENGLIVAGTLTSVVLSHENGEQLSESRLPSFDASLFKADSFPDFFNNIAQYSVRKNMTIYGTKLSDYSQDYQLLGGLRADKIYGMGGDDLIGGFKGDDKLIGGSGHDVFFFREGWGHDTVVDFEMKGGPGHQDLIAANFNLISQIAQHGSSTVIDFGHGDTLTLLHTHKNQISENDFYSL